MTNVLILHGTGASPNSHWFMWLKGKLVGRGYQVWLPQLPNADKPNSGTYTDFLLSNKNFQFSEETIVIGHSSGAVEILYLLQHLPDKTKIKTAILVSAFKDDLGWDSLSELFGESLDFKKIKNSCNKFIYIHSDNDPYCPIEHPKYLISKTGGELIVFKGQGHFNIDDSPDYVRFPEIMQLIDEDVKN